MTAQVRFAIHDGELRIRVPPELEPLDDFLESEIGADRAVLDIVEHHVRHDRQWEFAGDSCELVLDGDTVTITHDYTGTAVTLARRDLRDLLADLGAFLGGVRRREKS
ncbi:hypothetical protein BLA60_26590 [Actinophytocola xinjiangensis]|uniref:Uncharacterized protein n=1 Tax=Actinophytocola xinjiangensis TaxID=485602 RepID=A0A7Z1AWX0_9PSEU|nr:hypothetical protein [Actinophytocola xinjiangensis]OLF07499.1 hypothetical protein BLA60_26590 [Actinophytocola xinjiangensis]